MMNSFASSSETNEDSIKSGNHMSAFTAQKNQNFEDEAAQRESTSPSSASANHKPSGVMNNEATFSTTPIAMPMTNNNPNSSTGMSMRPQFQSSPSPLTAASPTTTTSPVQQMLTQTPLHNFGNNFGNDFATVASLLVARGLVPDNANGKATAAITSALAGQQLGGGHALPTIPYNIAVNIMQAQQQQQQQQQQPALTSAQPLMNGGATPMTHHIHHHPTVAAALSASLPAQQPTGLATMNHPSIFAAAAQQPLQPQLPVSVTPPPPHLSVPQGMVLGNNGGAGNDLTTPSNGVVNVNTVGVPVPGTTAMLGNQIGAPIQFSSNAPAITMNNPAAAQHLYNPTQQPLFQPQPVQLNQRHLLNPQQPLTVQDNPLVTPVYNGVNPAYPGLRVLNQSPPIFAIDNFLTKAECDFLICIAQDSFSPAPVVGQGIGEVSPSRTSSTCYLAREDLPIYLKKVCNLTGKPIEHCELPQVGRYLPSQQYLQHFDAFDLTNEDGQRFALNGGQRTITVLTYLNDVEKGGGTFFPTLNLEVQPKKGTAIVFFPSTVDGLLDKMALHAAKPAIDTKYISQVWIRQGNYEGFPSKRIFASAEQATLVQKSLLVSSCNNTTVATEKHPNTNDVKLIHELFGVTAGNGFNSMGVPPMPAPGSSNGIMNHHHTVQR